ncbi:MAG: S16 family serine protease [archaeon]|jgi:uncharacterized protein
MAGQYKSAFLLEYSRLVFITILLLLFLSPVFAILQSGDIKIFAVTEDHKGMAADLYMYAIPGTGKVAFVTSNSLVGKDTQTTGNIALIIAQKESGQKIADHDLIFDIRANASEVDGPSAGAAMTLLTYSLLSEKVLNPAVAITGTINNDSSVGMVGGVGPKAQAASKAGVKLFMIPSGEAVTEVDEDGTLNTVNLLDYGPRKLGMKIVEVSTIDQAIDYAYSKIEDIKVDVNSSLQMFIPKSIEFDPILFPMKQISQNYITDAQTVVNDATHQLEQSTLTDDVRGMLYNELSATKREVEMSQRFLDQNYLYSSANYAFNARVSAGTVEEIAQNPSMLSSDSSILASKISSLKNDLESLKKQCDFVPLDGFEWIIGAQQRMAYAQNALQKLDSISVVVDAPNQKAMTPDEKKNAEQAAAFQKVYTYESAQAWVGVAEDFIKEARKSNSKKVPAFTPDFTNMVKTKLSEIDALISDSNVSESSINEATRRYTSAKISFDNNFLFAALYDCYFAEAFVLSESSRKLVTPDDLYLRVEKDINQGTSTNSVWSSMFFDHAKFYYENAVFNKKIGRNEEVVQSIQTSYDMIFLSKKIDDAKNLVEEYLAFTKLSDYVSTEPVIDVKYTRHEDPMQYVLVAALVLAMLLVSVILLLGLVSRANRPSLGYDTRRNKVSTVLDNLDKALSQNKISDAEYFFMKKKYEQEISHTPNVQQDKRRLNLSIDDLRSKERALQKGLLDLTRHYKAGLIIPEDYEKNSLQVKNEIEELKLEIRRTQEELRLEKRAHSPLNLIAKKFSKKKDDSIKGTSELVEKEEKEEAAERAKRKKVLKKFAYKEKN